MNTTREKGMALVTALLVLLLVSSIIIGLSWMVMTNQRLSGNNANRQAAFYAAEAGMEKMTADLGTQYGATNALSAADITTVMGGAPVIPGVSYTTTPTSYKITYTPDPANGGNPLATNHTILTGPYAGLQGLLTPFTLTVQADLTDGSEAKLVRTVQTVGIPVFQFGIYSQVDLSYFPGPVFNFGGRVHTNGNLWLASGDTLTLADKVTAVGQVVVNNLSNGYPTFWLSGTQTPQTSNCQSSWSSTLPSNPNNLYPGAIMVATVPEANCLQLVQGSVTGSVSITNVATAPVNGNWYTLSTGTNAGQYAGNIRGGTTGVAPLSLSIATPAVGGTPIELIRRPVTGENVQLTQERYFTLSSVNILLDDTSALLLGTPGTCGAPVDLTSLAVEPLAPFTSFPVLYTGGPEGKLPLPTSGSVATAPPAYSQIDGHWIQAHKPILTGYILVDIHTAAGACQDVTWEILNLGFIGRNLNPLPKASLSGAGKIAQYSVSTLTGMAAASSTGGPTPVAPSGCADPSLNAVIRLARLRDNPSSVYVPKVVGGCGTAIPFGSANYAASDYWPNVLYDTREAVNRDTPPSNPNVGLNPNGALTAAGVISYVELDVNNLTRWFKGTIGANGSKAENVTGYAVYFSDRRAEVVDPAAGRKTGAYGYNDNVNSSDAANGCPDNKFEAGEDYAQTGALVRYVTAPDPLNNNSGTGISLNSSNSKLFPSSPAAIVANTSDGTCAGLGTNWPGAIYSQGVEARENPPLFFRQSLKIVNGGTISIGTCDGVPCGLTIASENPVYIQGDYNCLPASCGTGTFVASGNAAASVAADSVTLLSNTWNDVNSFAYPYDTSGGRPGNTTTYRTAIIAGKGLEFLQVAGTGQDFGTDGGVHNFLRYLEDWNGTLYYKGSLVSFFYSQQGIGVFKCCTTVYNPPTRGYSFDAEFLTPALLPPRTPMLRDVNNTGFTQDVSPTQ